MQLGTVTTDAAKDYGITFARQQYVAGLPDGHEHKGITDFDYFVLRIAGIVDSWAQQADQAAANPPTNSGPGTISADWRPQAVTDLEIYATKLMGIVTSMQTDYTQAAQTVNATACFDVKQQLKVINTTPAITAVLADPAATRAQFDAAVKARWLEIVAPAPNQVKADFKKYGGNTV